MPLAGWALSDDPRRPQKWLFRSGTLPPGSFLVVFASGNDRQPTAQPPLEPSSIPGLSLHLRADTIDPHDAAQVRGSAASRFVRRWVDSSRTTGDARAPSDPRQPRLESADGKAWLHFDGVDDLLTLAQPPGTNSFTLLAVVRPSAAHEIDEEGPAGVGGVTGQHWLFGAAHGGDDGAGAGLSLGTNGAALYEHGSAYMPARCVSSHPIGHRWAIVSVVYSNRQPILALDRLILRTSTSASLRDPVTAPVEIGSGAYGAFAGDVAEVIAFSRPLPPDEREALELHLALRHGIPLPQVFHTSFQLDADGESILLSQPDGTRADRIDFGPMPVDVSRGRVELDPEDLAFFASPTPGAPNLGPAAHRLLQSPTFSHPPGFHTHAFDLRLLLPTTDTDLEIRYTLDGSEPSHQSPRYLGPLPITARINVPNLYSAIPTAPGWQPPGGPVFKGTVVRARAFGPDALPSDTSTATFFVHPLGRARYTLPVVALSTAPRHLFDPDVGIYVPGNAPGGNYAQSGDAWERPVHVELFETNGTRVLSQPAGLRIHGNTSFNFPLKALRLHARNQGGTSPFQARIFPERTDTAYERLLLRPSGHDYHLTLMRDGLMQALVSDLAVDLQAYRPAILFLDGEYWGIHHLQEAFEKHFFARHHPGVDPDALDYLEGYPPGTFAYEGDSLFFDRLHASLPDLPLETDSGMDIVRQHLHTDSYRDYKLAEIFYYRWDIGNHRLWRPRTPEGRLRWILFDCDVGFGGFWSEPDPWSFDMLRAVLEPSGSLHGHNNETTTHLLRQLLRHAGFRRDFIGRATDLLNSNFTPERMLGFIDRMAAEISPSLVEHVSRWRQPASYFDWTRNVDALRTFARLRPAHVRLHFRNFFGLGEEVALRLESVPTAQGTVSVNSLDPLTFPAADAPWTGIYFRGQPIRLAAVPRPGWTHVGWANLPGFTNAALTLTLTQPFTTRPIFIPERPLALQITPGSLPGTWTLRVEGPPNARVMLERSSDLRVWQDQDQLALSTDGTSHSNLPHSANTPWFLRARQAPFSTPIKPRSRPRTRNPRPLRPGATERKPKPPSPPGCAKAPRPRRNRCRPSAGRSSHIAPSATPALAPSIPPLSPPTPVHPAGTSVKSRPHSAPPPRPCSHTATPATRRCCNPHNEDPAPSTPAPATSPADTDAHSRPPGTKPASPPRPPPPPPRTPPATPTSASPARPAQPTAHPRTGPPHHEAGPERSLAPHLRQFRS